MPLLRTPPGAKSAARSKIRSQNISELVHSGRPVKQAVAIAFDVERRAAKTPPRKRRQPR